MSPPPRRYSWAIASSAGFMPASGWPATDASDHLAVPHARHSLDVLPFQQRGDVRKIGRLVSVTMMLGTRPPCALM
jgi:hypothetical protein